MNISNTAKAIYEDLVEVYATEDGTIFGIYEDQKESIEMIIQYTLNKRNELAQRSTRD